MSTVAEPRLTADKPAEPEPIEEREVRLSLSEILTELALFVRRYGLPEPTRVAVHCPSAIGEFALHVDVKSISAVDAWAGQVGATTEADPHETSWEWIAVGDWLGGRAYISVRYAIPQGLAEQGPSQVEPGLPECRQLAECTAGRTGVYTGIEPS